MRPAPAIGILMALLAAGAVAPARASSPAADASDLLVVDCALPGQIRQLGRHTTYVAPRRPVRTTARDCRIRGGEYVVSDRATLASALAVWLQPARDGDPEAQTVVGELFERGAGNPPDYQAAAQWYQRAAAAGNPRAMVNLGNLYERGLGVAADPRTALGWYRRAAGLPEAIELEPVPDVAHRQPAAAPPAPADTVAEPRPEDSGPAVELAGPDIVLIEPQVGQSRGLVKVRVAAPGPVQRVVGRISAPAGILSATINAEPVTVNEAGVFMTDLTLPARETEVRVSAIDRAGQRADLSFTVAPAPPAAAPAPPQQAGPAPLQLPGQDYALLIGNDAYQYLPALHTPIADVERIGAVLQDRYGFQVRTLRNATRYQTLSALNDLRERATSDDRLLIYYAGHGELDDTNMRGHWLPVDAEPDNTANWLSNVDVTDILNVIRARQVLLVADSCYSGTLTRSSLTRLEVGLTADEQRQWLELMAGKRARVVLTSGGLAPVLDFGGGNHSVFAAGFIDALTANGEVLLGRGLYQAVAARVALAAADYDFEQIPQYAPIAGAGHESGDFILRPRSTP